MLANAEATTATWPVVALQTAAKTTGVSTLIRVGPGIAGHRNAPFLDDI